ncbi:AEC family transporter [Pigmentiphaga aceris]|uniref:AEC family transporter n=1 Tax=Pigmentiphaga aceris TaxID=1940612 RepID=A0A5C0B0C0_9BURK|nr:AEC family transporter [Pigmentiphaga aceris]QEI08048.1 AEC family transporter [Pigmentiphaga aceris]
MNTALLVLPDFLLIALGWLMRRRLGFSGEFFAGSERAVYYLLFPALLFRSTVNAQFELVSAAGLIWAGLALLGAGALMSWLALPLFKPKPLSFASCVQCGFRFNSYVALALAGRLFGDAGVSTIALLIAFCVPAANMLAVYALAKHSGASLWRQLLRNPLLVATVVGLVCNFAGIRPPDVADAVLGRLGNAAIAFGLICVGGSLVWRGAGEARGMTTYLVAVKLILTPLVAIPIGYAFGLPLLEHRILVLFAALPTASSAYVLATRMGGNGPMVAMLISVGTVLSAVTIPLWMLWAG